MNIEKMYPNNSLSKFKSNMTWTNFWYGLLLLAIVLTIIYFALISSTNSVFLESASAMTTVVSDHAYIEQLSTESDGTSHVYGFKLCAGDEPLHSVKILITSDSDVVILNPEGVIAKGDCRIFGVHINANNPDSIEAKLIEPNRV